MKRRTLDLLFSIGGVGLAGLLLIIGVVMSSNADFSNKYVTDQLAQQKSTFKAADAVSPLKTVSRVAVRSVTPKSKAFAAPDPAAAKTEKKEKVTV